MNERLEEKVGRTLLPFLASQQLPQLLFSEAGNRDLSIRAPFVCLSVRMRNVCRSVMRAWEVIDVFGRLGFSSLSSSSRISAGNAGRCKQSTKTQTRNEKKVKKILCDFGMSIYGTKGRLCFTLLCDRFSVPLEWQF